MIHWCKSQKHWKIFQPTFLSI
uniref:Uncharacterized protein n=1 Tax=Anguilla anguilla TaxID=7936 RepID=A0A0E9XK64_ANGAN